MNQEFWILLAANLPLLAAFFIALQKRWLVMGVTFDREMISKDKDIEFREKLRQEALADKVLLEERFKEIIQGNNELSEVVKHFAELNEQVLSELFKEQGWDGIDRRGSGPVGGRTRTIP